MFAPDQIGSFQTILFRQNGYHIDHDQNMHFFIQSTMMCLFWSDRSNFVLNMDQMHTNCQ